MAKTKHFVRVIQLCSVIVMLLFKQPEVDGKIDTDERKAHDDGESRGKLDKIKSVSGLKSDKLQTSTRDTTNKGATNVYRSTSSTERMTEEKKEKKNQETTTDKSTISEKQTDFPELLDTTTRIQEVTAGANKDTDQDSVTDSLRATIQANLDLLCPTGDVCRGKWLGDLGGSHYMHCCQECSCEHDCGNNQTCCFAGDERNDSVKYFGRECLHLTTNNIKFSERHLYAAYEMEAKCPNSDVRNVGFNEMEAKCPNTDERNIECDEEEEKLHNVSCGEQVVAPWGSFYPVYSQSVGKIFKNKVCADCNGVNDVVPFDALLVCNIIKVYENGDTRVQDIVNIDSFLQGNSQDSLCYVNFNPKLSFSELEANQCLPEPITQCLSEDFDLPEGISMSKEEVIQACTSDFYSAYRQNGAYANVFCHICNKEVYRKDNICQSLIDFPRDGTKSKFISLIDPVYFDNKRNMGGANEKLQKACLPKKALPADCRVIFCPAGRIHDENGDCTFPTTAWYIGTYKLTLRLTPTQAAPFEYVNSPSGRFDLSKLKWPSQNRWSLALLANSISTISNVSSLNYFIAVVTSTNPLRNQSRMLHEIEKFLKRNWLYHATDKSLVLHAELTEFKIIDVLNDNYAVPRYYRYNDFESNKLEFKWNLLYELISFGPPSFTLTVTKMFYCYQIELLPHEFELSHGDTVLYHKEKDRFFFDGQFALVAKTDTEEQHSRICIENSGFVRQNVAMATVTTYTQLPVTISFLLVLLIT